jgi:thiol-disulfide isomerase/thioredoxin
MAKFRKRSIKKTKTSKQKRMKRTIRSKSKKSTYGGSGNGTIILMMWMEGCGHCILLNKTWTILKNEIKNVKFVEMESRQLDYEFLKKYNIASPHGFPTLVKIKNGIVCDEPISRDIDELRKWIKS